MSRPELVIFDCDGVLVDTEPLGNTTLGAALRDAGVAIDDATVATQFRGWSMTSVVDWIRAERDVSLGARFLPDFQESLFRTLRHGVAAMPGADATLASLVQQRCVASSGEPEKMRLSLSLTGLLGWFGSQLFSATQVKRGKPAPDLFLFAAASMGVRPEACVVVEDSVAGVEAAHAAGMRVFGYAPEAERLHGQHCRLGAAGALPLHDLRELPGRLATDDW